MVGLINYDQYIGYLSQNVAIDIDICMKKLLLLINDKNLRQKLGNNAKKIANNEFSWSNIISQYKDLGNDLDKLRTGTESLSRLPNFTLPADRLDPFFIFETYPTFSITGETLIIKNNKIHGLDIKTVMSFKSVMFSVNSLPSIDLFNKVNNIIDENKEFSLNDICDATNLSIDIVSPIIIWLLKYSFISLTGDNNE